MKTIVDLPENSAGKYVNNPHLLEKKSDHYESISYRETKDLANLEKLILLDPKAIILSHRNYTANIEQTLTLMDVPEWWTTLLVLPRDHSLGDIHFISGPSLNLQTLLFTRDPVVTLSFNW